MINKILVAVDGSAVSNRALAMASQLAIQNEAALYLLHVIRNMQVPPELKKLAEVEHINEARTNALEFVAGQILGTSEQRAKKKGVKSIRTTTAIGDPASCIVKHATKNKVDMVVIGTRGLGGVKGMLLGSVSRKVANTCNANVLIVR